MVEDEDKTGTGEVLRLGQQTKIKTKTASNISHGPSGCRALAGGNDIHLAVLETIFIASYQPVLCSQKDHVRCLTLF